jgi:hypothetical protein
LSGNQTWLENHHLSLEFFMETPVEIIMWGGLGMG